MTNFGQMFFETSIPDSYGRDRRAFYMNRDGFTLLAMGFTGKAALKFKLAYINAFNEMDSFIKKQVDSQLPSKPEDILIWTLKQQKNLKGRVDRLEDTMRISGAEQFKINEFGKHKAIQVLGGKESAAYQYYSKKVFAQLWRDFKKHFVIPRYSELPHIKVNEAMQFINYWQPDTEIRLDIDKANKADELIKEA